MKMTEKLSGRKEIQNGEYTKIAKDFSTTYAGDDKVLESFDAKGGKSGMDFVMKFNDSDTAKKFADTLKKDDGVGDLDDKSAGLAADIMSHYVYDDVESDNAVVTITNVASTATAKNEETKPTHWRFNFGRVDTSKKTTQFNESFDELSKKFAEDGMEKELNMQSYEDAYEEVFDWVIGAMPDGDNSTWSNAANALMDAYYEGSEDTMTEKTSKKGKHTTESTKHMKESHDGWSDVADQTNLERVLDDLSQLQYEVKNCRRGAYTDCFTAQELSKYIERLATKLSDVADDIANIKEEDD